jgi:hypothetical protein
VLSEGDHPPRTRAKRPKRRSCDLRSIGGKQTQLMSAMTYELKAECELRAGRSWHIVHQGETRTLCGIPLAPASTTRPIKDLHHVTGACQPCEVLHFGATRRKRTKQADLILG